MWSIRKWAEVNYPLEVTGSSVLPDHIKMAYLVYAVTALQLKINTLEKRIRELEQDQDLDDYDTELAAWGDK